MRPRWGWILMVVLSAGVLGYAAAVWGALWILGDRPDLVASRAHGVALAVHIAGGAVALALAPFQVSVRTRARRPTLHRALGRVYLSGVAVGGLAGLAAVATTASPALSRVGFGGLAVAWLATGALAWRSAVRRRFEIHRAWVVRNVALTLAAVTFRLWLVPLIVAFGAFDPAYVVASFACWVPNLAVAEVLVRRRRWLAAPKDGVPA